MNIYILIWITVAALIYLDQNGLRFIGNYLRFRSKRQARMAVIKLIFWPCWFVWYIVKQAMSLLRMYKNLPK